MTQKSSSELSLIAHVLYRFDIGGLENGRVNIINNMPEYRHAIFCITDYTNFQDRIKRDDVEIIAFNKKPGFDFALFFRLFSAFRRLKPEIIHSYNLAGLEAQLPATLAGVPHHIHGEQGWDTFDPDGSNKKYQWLRRFHKPLIDRYIPLSLHLEDYLLHKVHVKPKKICRIYNGVDKNRFQPVANRRDLPVEGNFNQKESLVIGAVGRMHGVKDQLNLVHAFILLHQRNKPEVQKRLRLVCIGDGPLKEKAEQLLADAGLTNQVWLPGARSDIDQCLQGFDVYVLPSQAEGISNSLLEAMATGVASVVTAVGGNPELIIDGETGYLVPSKNAQALADALQHYVDQPELIEQHGRATRKRVEEVFALEKMVARYKGLYDELVAGSR